MEKEPSTFIFCCITVFTFILLSCRSSTGLDSRYAKNIVITYKDTAHIPPSKTLEFIPTMTYIEDKHLILVSKKDTIYKYEFTNKGVLFLEETITIPIAKKNKITGITSYSYKSQTIIAISVSVNSFQEPGFLVLMNIQGVILSSIPLGAHPINPVFSKDGRYIVIVNQGLANSSYTINPLGSVHIISITGTEIANSQNIKIESKEIMLVSSAYKKLRTINTTDTLNASTDLQPHSVAISHDSLFAYITLPVNNAIAKVKLADAQLLFIKPIGYKNERFFAIDVVNDSKIKLKPEPVFSFYMPTSILTIKLRSPIKREVLLTANSGWIRQYQPFSDFVPINRLAFNFIRDPLLRPLIQKTPTLLGSIIDGDINQDGLTEQIYIPGSRSISIWNTNASLITDSGQQIEYAEGNIIPNRFNASFLSPQVDSTSTSYGPRPNDLAIGTIQNQLYLFVTLQTTGDIAIFTITKSAKLLLIAYVDTHKDLQPLIPNNPSKIIFIPSEKGHNAFIVILFNGSSSLVSYEIHTSKT